MRELFTNCIKTTTILNTDAGFRNKLRQALSKLMPYQVGAKGQLQEWYQDWRPVDPSHRHLSHLYPVFPGNEISPEATPGLAVAAKKALSLRAKTNCSWGFPLKAACWARLGEADSAWTTWENQLRYVDPKSKSSKDNYGLFPNFFNSDGADVIMNGNGCATAVMTEMLVQSTSNEIKLLPALPNVFATGSVKGICARGGFVVDMDWRSGSISSANIYSKLGNTCVIRMKGRIKIYRGSNPIKITQLKSGPFSFKTSPGAQYKIVAG
jgi:alpha-L-fucosidase 2